MITLASLALSTAHAASLDLLQVGGAYGTPGATNPTALWWNPAGLAVGGGKIQFLVEGAPTFAKVSAFRANPSYGELNPDFAGAGYPTEYDYSGTDTLSFTGVVPFVGVSSSLMVPGLGVGLGLAVPTARGGESEQEWGANRYAIRAASIQAIHLMAGASYRVMDKISFGASLQFVDSSYYADTDTSIYPDIADTAAELFGGEFPPSFQDGLIEDRGYTSTLIFGGEEGNGGHGVLKDTALTFGAGLYLTPLGDKVGVSLAYVHGVRLDHTGDLTMKFQCPPDYDVISRTGAEQNGICNTTLKGTGTIGYNLPSRLNLGVVVSPIDRLRLEVMGSYVMWSAFTDYDIHTEIGPDQVQVDDEAVAEETAELLSQDRQWARDNQDTFWVGVDAKARLMKKLTGGARLIYDHHAIPDAALSANNVDNDEVILGLLAEVDPIDQLGIGLSFAHHFLMERTTTTSAFGVSLEDRKADRYFYPSANGTYGGSINRLGLTVRGHFGGQGW